MKFEPGDRVLYTEIFNGPPREIPCVLLAMVETTLGPAVRLRRRGRHKPAFWAPLSSVRPFSRLVSDGHGGWVRPWPDSSPSKPTPCVSP